MSVLGAILLGAVASLATPRPAAGHATVYLFGARAVAGEAGTMTLRIPHGCAGGLTTDRIVTWFGPRWPLVEPEDVAGWTARIVRRPGGAWAVVWTATDGGLPDGESGDFPVAVIWPVVAGDYATPTVQYCGDVSMSWTDRYRGAADGDQPSPVEYPSPWVHVLDAQE